MNYWFLTLSCHIFLELSQTLRKIESIFSFNLLVTMDGYPKFERFHSIFLKYLTIFYPIVDFNWTLSWKEFPTLVSDLLENLNYSVSFFFFFLFFPQPQMPPLHKRSIVLFDFTAKPSALWTIIYNFIWKFNCFGAPIKCLFHNYLGPHFLCWISGVVSFNTWLIK